MGEVERTESAFPTAFAAQPDMTQMLFNPFLPEVHQNPYPHYRRLRETAPIHQPFPGAYMLSRHRDVAGLLRNPHVSSDRRKSPMYEIFLASLPDPVTGECSHNQIPVYRLWNARADSNHRYTTSPAIRDDMVSRGYVKEGYGPEAVAMCVGGGIPAE